MNPGILSTQESTISTFICRICHEGNNNEELVDPCECSGTVAFVHVSCLEKWLATSNTRHCDLCNYEFTIEKKNKLFTRQSFHNWFNSTLNDNPRILICDTLCLLFLTPMCVVAMYLCGLGAVAYGPNRFWESVGLISLNIILLITYLAWLIVTIRFHLKSWKQWCESDSETKIIINHQLNGNRLSDINFINANSSLHTNECSNNTNIGWSSDVTTQLPSII
ncbi:hypothetical protein PV327_009285 [Microctonus hyperodae]|uniref:RING-CH-type domain-containing protein n=1 Tax=Microctonus hyperodae TaxID=165561 RepID=A0AA39KVT9_MICHY|nr:hypothetical protein PV327_009285 [Microctonus hyperodae]